MTRAYSALAPVAPPSSTGGRRRRLGRAAFRTSGGNSGDSDSDWSGSLSPRFDSSRIWGSPTSPASSSSIDGGHHRRHALAAAGWPQGAQTSVRMHDQDRLFNGDGVADRHAAPNGNVGGAGGEASAIGSDQLLAPPLSSSFVFSASFRSRSATVSPTPVEIHDRVGSEWGGGNVLRAIDANDRCDRHDEEEEEDDNFGEEDAARLLVAMSWSSTT